MNLIKADQNTFGLQMISEENPGERNCKMIPQTSQ